MRSRGIVYGKPAKLGEDEHWRQLPDFQKDRIPAEPWSESRAAEPGLIVVYNLAALDGDLLKSLREHRPGQILWAHASCWTSEPPFAADRISCSFVSMPTH